MAVFGYTGSQAMVVDFVISHYRLQGTCQDHNKAAYRTDFRQADSQCHTAVKGITSLN